MLQALDAPRRMPSEIDLTLLWSGLILLLILTFYVIKQISISIRIHRNKPVK